MNRLTKTQVSLLASYSSPFILLFALALNLALLRFGVNSGFTRLLVLSAGFPLGFLIGRMLYLMRSHIEILYDEKTFQVFKGRRRMVSGNWRNYRLVAIVLNSFGRPDIRLYESADGDFVDLPISGTTAGPQDFRNYVQDVLSRSHPKRMPASLPVVGAS
jgi:hypothetical protein